MPGIVRKWSATWSHKVLGSFLGLTISILTIRSDEKPLGWSCKRWKVATNSPATNRTTKQNAVCRAIRARIQRARECELSPPLSASTGRIAEAPAGRGNFGDRREPLGGGNVGKGCRGGARGQVLHELWWRHEVSVQAWKHAPQRLSLGGRYNKEAVGPGQNGQNMAR